MSNTNHQKVAFITGGNRGVGLETARQLYALGIHPVIGARQRDAGIAAVHELLDSGVAADMIVVDVTKEADRQEAFEYFETRYGRLDILINNAGVHLEGEPAIEHLYTASTVPEHVLRDTMDANFFALVALTNKLLPLIRKAGDGRIVNLSTLLASLTLMADPAAPIYDMKSLAYDTSKVAINSYTVQLAHELRGSDVKVNSAHPGWVQTRMGGRLAQMSIEEGAKTSVALATLPVNGASGGFFHLGESVPW